MLRASYANSPHSLKLTGRIDFKNKKQKDYVDQNPVA